jgi:hypothetical protein
VEELIPTLQQLLSMIVDQFADSVNLFSVESATALKPDWVEPELRFTFVAFDMDMGRLGTIAGVEEEPKWTHSEYSRHVPMLHRLHVKTNG